MVFRYLMPRYPVHMLRAEVDRLLSGALASVSDGSAPVHGRSPINIWENDDALSVELEIPGVEADQIEISVVDNELSIKVERPKLEAEEIKYHRRERAAGGFGRVVRLPADVDADRVQAELHNGVLTITLPRAESERPRKIEVTSVN